METYLLTSSEKSLKGFTFNNLGMKSIILATALSAIIVMNLTAQNQQPILLGEEGHKTTYQQNGKYLSRKELAEVLKSNKESLPEYKKSAAKNASAGVFIIPGLIVGGGGLVYSGKALIELIIKNDENLNRDRNIVELSLLSSLGLLIIGGTIAGSGERHLARSINNYNNSLNTGRAGNVTVCFGFTREGVGVRLKF
jgi:hypothetical protein